MSIKKIFPGDIEVLTLETHPYQTFASNSAGTTGSIYVYPRRSNTEKEVHPLSNFSSSLFHDVDMSSLINQAKLSAKTNGSNTSQLGTYLQKVNEQSISARKQQTIGINRYVPGATFDFGHSLKNTVRKILFPSYRTAYATAQYSYTNYHTLNFFTSDLVPSNSVLLYPQIVATSPEGVLTGSYIFTKGFSFDFWIKPTQTSVEYMAGTILHLSSTYAISLISGSSTNGSAQPDKFRILLQLSSSTDIPPSDIVTSSLPPLAFLSDDNSLTKDIWHHVTIRWGTNSYNYGTGSFVINGNLSGYFVIPSSSVCNHPYDFATVGYPTVLCVGNYYKGTNTGGDALSRFFAVDPSTREGLLVLDNTPLVNEPGVYNFPNPLKAEVHELKIYNKYLNNNEIASLGAAGPTVYSGSSFVGINSITKSFADSGILFYLPPFFTRESPIRQFYNGSGGVLTTPFFTEDGTTLHPFEIDMSFGLGGHYINLENFTRDFATGNYPKLLNLSASAITIPSIMPKSANDLLYATGSVRKRSLTILPCDNGNFYPNCDMLRYFDSTSFVTDAGNTNYDSISLLNLYPTSSLYGLTSDSSGSILSYLMGPDPAVSTSLGVAPSGTPTILQRTKDNTSNQISIFDISNIFYGIQIEPTTFTITDGNISGSGGTQITLKDDGFGNLYRSNCSSSAATWNSVGNIFYNEGIVLIKNPHIYFFGETNWEITFQGKQNLHVFHLKCTASPLMETSSSNPNYLAVSASDLAHDIDQKFVYITDVLIHDDNLNVICRNRMAQPIVKRSSEKLVFSTRMDY